MSIIDYIKDIRAGRTAAIVEPTPASKTKGHDASEPGLRGHSIDHETYPWRVVGGYFRLDDGRLVKTWEIHGSDGRCYASHCGTSEATLDSACRAAHRRARLLKRQYPAGCVTEQDGAVGGPVETVAERLAGCVVAYACSLNAPSHRYRIPRSVVEHPATITGWNHGGQKMEISAFALVVSKNIYFAIVHEPDSLEIGQ